jgi:predicted DNA-binding transcriptional regulator YafY
MHTPILRVLEVLEVLQARERVTGADLARRLEVSPRTVQRYISRLQDLGIPVESTRGVGGSYRLKAGFRLPPLMFSDDEAFALSLGLRALQHLGLQDLLQDGASAGLKLERVLPKAVAQRVRDVEEAIQLEPSPWTVSTDAATLKQLAGAIRASRKVHFAYQNHQGLASTRAVAPYAVRHHDGRWYMVGFCQQRQALRTFRLDRIAELSLLEATFEPPENFDARGYLQASMPFIQEKHSLEVWLDCPLEVAQKKIQSSRVALESHQAGTLLRCTRDTLEPFAAMLLGLGVSFKVIQSEALRDTFRVLVERARDSIAG